MGRVLDTLRRWVRASGYDLKRFAPLENPHLRRQAVLASHGVELVIDGGANRGQYALRLREFGYTGRIVSIEPGRAAYARLSEAARDDADWTTRRAALGREAGRAELLVSANSVSSSLFAACASDDPGRAVVAREPVEVVTLEALLREERAGVARCLVKLDLQGAEMDALDGAGADLAKCELLEVELAFEPVYEGQSTALFVLEQLAQRGFDLVGVAPNTLDPANGHLVEIDALLARRHDGADAARSFEPG